MCSKKCKCIIIFSILFKVKGKDSLILIRHNGSTLAGAFDTDNYKHNTLAQMVLVDLAVGDQVSINFIQNLDFIRLHFMIPSATPYDLFSFNLFFRFGLRYYRAV